MADNQHRHWILPIYLGGDYRNQMRSGYHQKITQKHTGCCGNNTDISKIILRGNLYQSLQQKFKNYPWRNRKLFVEESEIE